jgi:hypothetical protein
MPGPEPRSRLVRPNLPDEMPARRGDCFERIARALEQLVAQGNPVRAEDPEHRTSDRVEDVLRDLIHPTIDDEAAIDLAKAAIMKIIREG